MRRSLVTALTVALALSLVAPAIAKAPPTGKYDCTISGMSFDSVTIKSGNKYKRFGKSGKFTAGAKKIKFPDKFVGYKITFKTGPLKGFKGRWYRAKDSAGGTYEIALRNPEDDFESIYCDRVKK